MTTRRAVARYLADAISGPGRADAIRHAAAWLADGRRRQAPYLVRDVGQILAARGYLAATVTDAHALDAGTVTKITEYLRRQTGATDIELAVLTDKSVIAGLRIETPTQISDQTVSVRLKRLEGVSHA